MTTRLPVDRRLLLGLASAAAIAAGLLAQGAGAIVAVAALTTLAALAAFPEVTLSLFLLAGVIKAPLAALTAAAGIDFDITLFLAAVLILGLLVRGLRTGFRTLLPPAECLLPLGCLSMVVLISALLGPETPYGREKAFRFVTLTNLAVLAPFACLNRHDRLLRFLLVNIGLGLLMLPLGHVSSEGLSAFGSTHIATGRTLGIGVLASAYLGLRRTSLPGRLLWFAVGAVLFAGLLLSGSRGSFVAVAAAIAAAGIVALAIRRRRRRVLAAGLAAGVAALIVAVFAPAAVETMNRRLAATVADPLTLSAHTRVERATAAIDVFGENPIFGAGIGGFDMLFSNADTGRGDYPHNILLEVAAELGLVGLAALLLLTFRSLRRPLRAVLSADRPRELPRMLPLFILTLACYALVNALFSGDLNDNRLLFAFLGMCHIPLEG